VQRLHYGNHRAQLPPTPRPSHPVPRPHPHRPLGPRTHPETDGQSRRTREGAQYHV